MHVVRHLGPLPRDPRTSIHRQATRITSLLLKAGLIQAQQKAWTDSLILAGVLEAWQLAKKQSDLPPFELFMLQSVAWLF